jgi:hypothetical protein
MQSIDGPKFANNLVRTLKTTESPRSNFGPVFHSHGKVVLMCVWILAAIYLAFYLNRDWIPSDDGAFAQSAERVLRGELPHRDFDEVYTGGLACLHALAFRVLGTSLTTLRFVLFAVFLLWVPAVFYVASRFVSPIVAGGLVLLSAAWSVPNYTASTASWYNLFFAIFGVAALLRYLETGARRWLFVSGICAGLSILVKVIGFYYIAGILLFFLFREQCITATGTDPQYRRSRLYRLTVISGSIAFLVVLLRLVREGPIASSLVYFVLPATAMLALLVGRELRRKRGPDPARFATLAQMCFPFTAGAALPIAIFLAPYFLLGSVGALVHGVFILPMKRFGTAVMPPPGPSVIAYMIPIILVLILAFDFARFGRLLVGCLLILGLGVILILSAKSNLAFAVGWHSFSSAIPVLALVGTAVLWKQAPTDGEPERLRRQQLTLLLSVMSFCSLVMFPFYTPVYFCYVAPLAILSAAGIFKSLPRPPGLVLGSLVVFYILFAVLRVTPAMKCRNLNREARCQPIERLLLERAGKLWVARNEALLYDKLIPLIQSHAHGQFMYATPDCPEVYFLSGLRNPTRTLYDLFDERNGRDAKILQSIESHGVNVIALNGAYLGSGPIGPGLRSALEERFPNSEKIDYFEVRWK